MTRLLINFNLIFNINKMTAEEKLLKAQYILQKDEIKNSSNPEIELKE